VIEGYNGKGSRHDVSRATRPPADSEPLYPLLLYIALLPPLPPHPPLPPSLESNPFTIRCLVWMSQVRRPDGLIYMKYKPSTKGLSQGYGLKGRGLSPPASFRIKRWTPSGGGLEQINCSMSQSQQVELTNTSS